MDVHIMEGFLDQGDPSARARALHYFEQLKDSADGWKSCIHLLTSLPKQQEQVKFFCFQVISHYIKTKYRYADSEQQQHVKEFVKHWIQSESGSQSTLIRNKAAQVVCQVFLCDFPARWPSFFEDLLCLIPLGEGPADVYLRAVLAINAEIGDREVPRSQEELDTYTFMKDTIRETCVTKLVDSWHHILVTYQTTRPEITCLCLDVIGSYIAWIDIGLIANDRFVREFSAFLSVPNLRESTCDCIAQVVSKGMDPMAKIKLVESYCLLIEEAGVLHFTGSGDNEDFMVKLSTLINTMGTAILNSWTRMQKAKNARGMEIAAEAIHGKTNLLLKFLSNSDDEVSMAVIEFTREYLQFLKNKAGVGAYTPTDSSIVQAILYIVINKYKYDPSTDFTCQDQEDAFFQEYRKSLKVIFDNLTLLDMELVFSSTKRIITDTLSKWRALPYYDIEVAITFLYLLGEAVPNCQGNPIASTSDKKAEMNEMLHLLATSGVSRQGHIAVLLQFFETVVRFEKYFAQEPQHIPEVLAAFLDDRGLRNPDPHLRSRASYLFYRFIKCLKTLMPNYTEGILRKLQDLFVLSSPLNGVQPSLISQDDQLYIYETASILIVSGDLSPETKLNILKQLLLPVAETFETLLKKLPVTSDERQRREIAQCMNHAIAVTSRTSKAFSNQQTMKSNGCMEVYLQALQTFLGALNLPYEQATLQCAVRQYLHRMVVCLESEVLPFFPTAAEKLLQTTDIRSIQEFIPLINQLIGKFKKEVVPFVQQIFLPFVSAIFGALSVPVDDNDRPAQSERQFLQRSYFLFIAAIVTNNITEVIAAQSMQDVERVLLTVIQGAVDFPDPVAQKTCFAILRRIVEQWGGPGGPAGFPDFLYAQIVPACFLASLRPSFDLADAQTVLALSESAMCLRTALERRGPELLSFLQDSYLPSMGVAPEVVGECCRALAGPDAKAFKSYFKFFIQNLKR